MVEGKDYQTKNKKFGPFGQSFGQIQQSAALNVQVLEAFADLFKFYNNSKHIEGECSKKLHFRNVLQVTI